MRRKDTRRIERWFAGELNVEQELALERDAREDDELGRALERTRSLREALDATPEPPTERLDVEALVQGVRARLEVAPAAPPRVPTRRRFAAPLAALALAAVLLVVSSLRTASIEPTVVPEIDARDEVAAGAPEPEAGAAARAIVPRVPVDVARRAEALEALALVLADDEVRGGFDVAGPAASGEELAAFAARVDEAFNARVEGAWPLTALAHECLRGGGGVEVRAAAARLATVGSDRLTASRLAHALEDAGDEPRFERALLEALWDLDALDAIAEHSASADDVTRVEAVLKDVERRERFARALPERWTPETPQALAVLADAGVPAARVLARLALDDGGALGAEATRLLAAHADGGDALVERIEATRGFDGRARERALARVAAIRPPVALGTLVRYVRRSRGRGDARALEVLASLPGTASAHAMLDLESDGLNVPSSAWRELVLADPLRVAAALDGLFAASGGDRRDVDERARAFAARIVEVESPLAAPGLARLTACAELAPRSRERAALALVELARDSVAALDAKLRAEIEADLARGVQAALTGELHDSTAAALVLAAHDHVGAHALTLGTIPLELPTRAADTAGSLSARQSRVERWLAADPEVRRARIRFTTTGADL